jgi:hypothetical protein
MNKFFFFQHNYKSFLISGVYIVEYTVYPLPGTEGKCLYNAKGGKTGASGCRRPVDGPVTTKAKRSRCLHGDFLFNICVIIIIF